MSPHYPFSAAFQFHTPSTSRPRPGGAAASIASDKIEGTRQRLRLAALNLCTRASALFYASCDPGLLVCPRPDCCGIFSTPSHLLWENRVCSCVCFLHIHTYIHTSVLFCMTWEPSRTMYANLRHLLLAGACLSCMSLQLRRRFDALQQGVLPYQRTRLKCSTCKEPFCADCNAFGGVVRGCVDFAHLMFEKRKKELFVTALSCFSWYR